MKERLQIIVETEKLSYAKFAEMIGVQRSSISHFLSGRNKPSFDVIHSILSKFPHISPDWFILGIGNMYREYPEKPSKPEEHTLFPPNPKVNDDSFTKEKFHSKEEKNEELVKKRGIEKIVFFFNDSTFAEYRPE
ncbi:MAG: helix-turn-helix transcriptional regulator [Tenuifilaceae bacterium]|jgi:transcriptional regulator with XRE-family HTH domain|nr:helix-turn-helix transcriptional regulator [Bacteroidales bacterium]MDI9515772.1 helix-turn-helix transcriptional regulator [Bacteroidota bacterium]NLH57441.1 helix-turn-helix transcriptional regulator [Rikenellaceae bacterium]OQC62174.1 MAG: helix-turn-helix protein [Bacteroidetes bacterium ADurb.Bin008]HNV81052.1 helix-turn-helix transcriptional regulator [Tenuifilaceae bacterium]